jgi:hypothetical protein
MNSLSTTHSNLSRILLAWLFSTWSTIFIQDLALLAMDPLYYEHGSSLQTDPAMQDPYAHSLSFPGLRLVQAGS